MKYLMIDARKAYYINSKFEECEINDIDKEDILYLLNQATDEAVDFEMDMFEGDIIDNPAQIIIYENLYKNLLPLKENKNTFIEESKRVYKDALEKYK